MLDRDKTIDGGPAHSLGGTIRRGKLWMFYFKVNKFLEKFVVFLVGNLRPGFLVIKPVVLFKFLTQP